ncbi:MAG TPA: hypothetical protein VMX13_02630 [Sedimentisphaerales bacterium]|nr:hypothetical protein [Sedimentisphaerales bacterium]
MAARKYARILIMVACGAALLLVPAGCRKKPQPPSTPIITPSDQQPPAVTTPDEQPPAVTPTDEQPPAVAPPKETPSTPMAGDTPPAVPEAGEDQMVVVPLVGVGPVKFGMSKEQVMQALGQPERMEGGGIVLYYLTSKGMSLMVDRRLGVRTMDCWSDQYPMPFPGMVTFDGKTDKGIAMGASREEVVAAYGEPDRTDSTGTLETLRYGKLGISFALASDGVVNIKIIGP